MSEWMARVADEVESAEVHLAEAQKAKDPAQRQSAWMKFQEHASEARAVMNVSVFRTKDEEKAKVDAFERKLVTAYLDGLKAVAADITFLR